MKGKTIITVSHGQGAHSEYAYPGIYPSFNLAEDTVDLNNEADEVVDTLKLSTLKNVIFVPAKEATSGD